MADAHPLAGTVYTGAVIHTPKKMLTGSGAPSFCWHCGNQLQRAPGKGAGLFFFNLVTGPDGQQHRIHGDCTERAILDGCKLAAAPSTPENAWGVATGYDGVTTHPEFGGNAGVPECPTCEGRGEVPTVEYADSMNGYPSAEPCPDCNGTGNAGVNAFGDAERLDWLMRQISGAELRRLGIVTSGGMTRELLDRMMAAIGVPVDHQQVNPEHQPMPGGKK